VDEHGWPHPAMASTLEMIARDDRNIRLATHAGSRTTRHLRANGRLTIIIADEQHVYYLKGDVLLRSASMNTAPHLSAFNVRVDSVLEDHAAEHEQARLQSGLRASRGAIDVDRANVVLRELIG
jgi:hypothetical protein